MFVLSSIFQILKTARSASHPTTTCQLVFEKPGLESQVSGLSVLTFVVQVFCFCMFCIFVGFVFLYVLCFCMFCVFVCFVFLYVFCVCKSQVDWLVPQLTISWNHRTVYVSMFGSGLFARYLWFLLSFNECVLG